MKQFLADTTVLVEYLRGNQQAKHFIETSSPSISCVTRAELIQGSRNKRDIQIVKNICNELPEIILTESITEKALSLLETFHLSHGLLLLDSLIAATALVKNLVLVTDNHKHFIFIKDLSLLAWSKIDVSYS